MSKLTNKVEDIQEEKKVEITPKDIKVEWEEKLANTLGKATMDEESAFINARLQKVKTSEGKYYY